MASITYSMLGNPAYPTTDGKPIAETDWHRDLMVALIETLKIFFAQHPLVYVSGNLLVFYVPNDKRRHLSPDVFVVFGVPKGDRLNYLTWEEGKGIDLVIELTLSSTRIVDVKRKFQLYQDVLKVKEYFLFDPYQDYLKPPLQGYRLRRGGYAPIRLVKGRLPSKVLGLHLEKNDKELRLYNPATKYWLPTMQELVAREAAARQRAEAEIERLRRELDDLRRRSNGQP